MARNRAIFCCILPPQNPRAFTRVGAAVSSERFVGIRPPPPPGSSAAGESAAPGGLPAGGSAGLGVAAPGVRPPGGLPAGGRAPGGPPAGGVPPGGRGRVPGGRLGRRGGPAGVYARVVEAPFGPGRGGRFCAPGAGCERQLPTRAAGTFFWWFSTRVGAKTGPKTGLFHRCKSRRAE